MPTLRDLMTLVCRHAESRGLSFGQECARDLEMLIRRELAGERVYIPPADSRKDPARTASIREASKRLPTGVVAARFGVTRRWVNMAAKKK